MTASLSTASDNITSDETDDVVVANETLIISPVPSRQGKPDMKEQSTSSVVGKDSGPPDGGYGWIVVMYVPSTTWS